MSVSAPAAGIFGMVVIGRMLVPGNASPDGEGIQRDEQPAAYWSIVGIGSATVVALLYIGIVNPFEP